MRVSEGEGAGTQKTNPRTDSMVAAAVQRTAQTLLPLL
jgi:hypothetical protein